MTMQEPTHRIVFRSVGRSLLKMQFIEAHLAAGHEVVIACNDQRRAIYSMGKRFPGCLFSTVGSWGLMIHRRQKL